MGMVPPRPNLPSFSPMSPMSPVVGQPSGGAVNPGLPVSNSLAGRVSPALLDFIEFQTLMASSRNLHLKDRSRVSVAKTSFISSTVAAGLTAIPTIFSAINGQADKLFLIPIIGTLAAAHGAIVGLLLNHNRD